MAKVGAQRAAELTGRSKSTIQRAMNSGKISFELDANGRRVIDVSELERGFGLKQQAAPQAQTQAHAVEQELEKASFMLEKERLQMKIQMLEQQLHNAENQISDLTEQRDRWQRQADQILLTSQHAQQQADELRDQIKERQQRAAQRKKERLEQRMKEMKAENENQGGAGLQSFFDKFKKRA